MLLQGGDEYRPQQYKGWGLAHVCTPQIIQPLGGPQQGLERSSAGNQKHIARPLPAGSLSPADCPLTHSRSQPNRLPCTDTVKQPLNGTRGCCSATGAPHARRAAAGPHTHPHSLHETCSTRCAQRKRGTAHQPGPWHARHSCLLLATLRLPPFNFYLTFTFFLTLLLVAGNYSIGCPLTFT